MREEGLPYGTEPVAGGEPIAMTADPELAAIAGRLPKNIYLGSSSWNFPGWRGIVWSPMSPERTLAARGLAAYSRYPVFRTAGIDRSYYRPLTARQYRDFADQVPESFRFLVKAPQSVTDSQLRDDAGRPTGPNPDYLNLDRAVDEFIGPVAEGLGEKAGPLVFEFSAQPAAALAEISARHAAIERLGEFFSALPREAGGLPLLYSAEMRTRILFTPRYINTVRPTGVRPVIGIHPSLPGVQRQIAALRMLDAPEAADGPWDLKGDVVIRWSLAAGGSYRSLRADWAPFDRIRRPDAATRGSISWLLVQAARSRVRAFAVANNKAEGCSPLTMRAIAGQVADMCR